MLFAANQAVALPDDPVAALWQCATSLREQRGDGHVAALISSDISGLESHVLVVASGAIDAQRLRSVRGWTGDEWAACASALYRRGMLDADGLITETGASVRARVELLTDQLALQPYADSMDDDMFEFVVERLRPIGRHLVQRGMIPVPNPIGVDPS